MSLVFISGGVRSGKSSFAEILASNRGTSVLYVATGVVTDEEMEKRIAIHRNQRPKSWGTLEIRQKLLQAVSENDHYDVILLDCLSTWVSNCLIEVPEKEYRNEMVTNRVLEEVKQFIAHAKTSNSSIIVVSNETGLGGIAMSPLGRWFQDLLGEGNQMVCAQADEAYFVVSGQPIRLKS